MLVEVPEGQDGLTAEERKYFRLCHPGGVRGVMTERPAVQEQDAEALPVEGYVVAFFPKITGLGQATLSWCSAAATFSQTPETAIAKFMDGILRGEKWTTYEDAGHRVRKVRMIDLGDA